MSERGKDAPGRRPCCSAGGGGLRAALHHQGLVLRRSCKFRMTLALNTSAGTVQCWAGGAGAGACGGAECVGASPHPSCDKVSSAAALGWGR